MTYSSNTLAVSGSMVSPGELVGPQENFLCFGLQVLP
jgi:hypothetical protein